MTETVANATIGAMGVIQVLDGLTIVEAELILQDAINLKKLSPSKAGTKAENQAFEVALRAIEGHRFSLILKMLEPLGELNCSEVLQVLCNAEALIKSSHTVSSAHPNLQLSA